MADKGEKSKPSGGSGMTAADAKNWEGRLKTEYEAPHKWNEAWGELFQNGIPCEYGARAEFLKTELQATKPLTLNFQDGVPFQKYGQVESRKQKFGYGYMLSICLTHSIFPLFLTCPSLPRITRYFDPLAPENQLPNVED